MAAALIFGTIWPLIALFLGARTVITSGAPEFAAEKEARLRSLSERIAVLEKKERQLRKQ